MISVQYNRKSRNPVRSSTHTKQTSKLSKLRLEKKACQDLRSEYEKIEKEFQKVQQSCQDNKKLKASNKKCTQLGTELSKATEATNSAVKTKEAADTKLKQETLEYLDLSSKIKMVRQGLAEEKRQKRSLTESAEAEMKAHTATKDELKVLQTNSNKEIIELQALSEAETSAHTATKSQLEATQTTLNGEITRLKASAERYLLNLREFIRNMLQGGLQCNDDSLFLAETILEEDRWPLTLASVSQRPWSIEIRLSDTKLHEATFYQAQPLLLLAAQSLLLHLEESIPF
jgi:hypothetical protein